MHVCWLSNEHLQYLDFLVGLSLALAPCLIPWTIVSYVSGLLHQTMAIGLRLHMYTVTKVKYHSYQLPLTSCQMIQLLQSAPHDIQWKGGQHEITEDDVGNSHVT